MRSSAGNESSCALQIAQSTHCVLNRIADDCQKSGDSRSVTARRNAELTDEGASHVALIREAGLNCCLGGCLAIGQEPPGKAHAPLHQVGMRRDSYLAGEAPQ